MCGIMCKDSKYYRVVLNMHYLYVNMIVLALGFQVVI